MAAQFLGMRHRRFNYGHLVASLLVIHICYMAKVHYEFDSHIAQDQDNAIKIHLPPSNNDNGTKHLESSTTSLPTSFPQHLVFIGDSLLRYSYLEWLHHQHYQSPAPESLINEKLSKSWYSYFQNSTAHFQGHMKCDCRRSQIWSLGSEVENRYYFRGGGHGQHRGSAALAATYIQAYGDNQSHGRYAPDDLGNFTISTEDDESGYKWGYMGHDWDNLFKEYVAKMEITPTLAIFNAGFWPCVCLVGRLFFPLSAWHLDEGPKTGGKLAKIAGKPL